MKVYYGWMNVRGYFLWVGGDGWELVEVYFRSVSADRQFLWVDCGVGGSIFGVGGGGWE